MRTAWPLAGDWSTVGFAVMEPNSPREPSRVIGQIFFCSKGHEVTAPKSRQHALERSLSNCVLYLDLQGISSALPRCSCARRPMVPFGSRKVTAKLSKVSVVQLLPTGIRLDAWIQFGRVNLTPIIPRLAPVAQKRQPILQPIWLETQTSKMKGYSVSNGAASCQYNYLIQDDLTLSGNLCACATTGSRYAI